MEALREHLGLDRLNLLGHSAGANLAMLYAARHPERIDRLVLLTPSTFAVGVTVTTDARRAIVRLREGEPWFGPASAAFDRINAGQATDEDWAAIVPLRYGRWDAAARAHHVGCEQRRNTEAAAGYSSEGAYRPDATRAALATLGSPVLVIAGELDANSPPSAMAELATLFPDATLSTLAGAGHFLWFDHSTRLTETITSFLRPS